MRSKTRATKILGIEYPIIQAPMAGGITTPQLVAAVSNAEALGSLGAAYLPPEKIEQSITEIRQLTDKPFAVNLFIPTSFEESPEKVRRANESMRPYRNELGIETPVQLSSYAPPFEEQLEAVMAARVPVFSFTFGTPRAELAGRVRENGTKVVGTATTVREGLKLEEAGVDLVVGQGVEAGGHRGTFLGNFGDAMVGTMALTPQLADALSIPVIASGGIADGRGLAAALALGAEAVQVGTAFLTCEESGAHPAYKEAVLGASEDDTVITRAFSGRPARSIKNRFLLEMSEHEEDLPPYPIHNAWTKDIRDAAREQARPEFHALWAGQAARLARPVSAAELVESMMSQARTILPDEEEH